MGKIFNIAGPCNPEDHCMSSATERVPDGMRLVSERRALRSANPMCTEIMGGCLFRGAKHAVECKKLAFYEKVA